jgi:hypothetical protein
VNIQKPATITTATTTDTRTETTTETTSDTTTTDITTAETTTTETTTKTTTTETTETIETFEDPMALVGGYVMPVNKLSVMSTYLVILGMIACLLMISKMRIRRKNQIQT